MEVVELLGFGPSGKKSSNDKISSSCLTAEYSILVVHHSYCLQSHLLLSLVLHFQFQKLDWPSQMYNHFFSDLWKENRIQIFILDKTSLLHLRAAVISKDSNNIKHTSNICLLVLKYPLLVVLLILIMSAASSPVLLSTP